MNFLYYNILYDINRYYLNMDNIEYIEKLDIISSIVKINIILLGIS